MVEETIALEEKLLFEQGDRDVSFGYKAVGVQFIDDNGTHDIISKDDTLAWPAVARRTYASTVNARMEPIMATITPFVKSSLVINHHPDDKLGLPVGTLASLHKVEGSSGCAARFIRAPPCPGPNFESVSFLHNRLGDLQVLPPGFDQWFYIKSSVAQPLPGHAICNIGDALNIFPGGILRSNIHRLVPSTNGTLSSSSPPNDVVELRVLSGQSERIAAAVAYAPPGKYAPGVTAMEWLARRVKSQRVTNCKGPESWTDRRGTEDTAIPSQGKI
ncbi:Clavaminate synthase-like protein [Epithele typhae]|uniref:Clavaminate synthase-like protein n=1 Tax=Epithele typhae TaxID=378194 RepID=UPI002007A494|nr:Clavaminate synthase-like protein [Epithele typhae]KAH9936766.1 Clavaminate synthase-like protein [Epithele typhae]